MDTREIHSIIYLYSHLQILKWQDYTKGWILVLTFFPLAFMWKEESLDIHGEVHSLLNSSVQKYAYISHIELSTAVSLYMVVNQTQKIPISWRRHSHEQRHERNNQVTKQENDQMRSPT